MGAHLNHRKLGYALLSGRGLEVGALDQPAPLPGGCSVTYCDAISHEQAAQLFPELDPGGFTRVDHLCDLDKEGLEGLASDTYDFVVFNHVVEHIANPIRAIEELVRVARPGGLLVISAPDKEYTFDKNRASTPFDHLYQEWQEGVTEVSDEHYLDFLKGVHPELWDNPNIEQDLPQHLAGVRRRREHAHVWNSREFRQFLADCFELLKVSAVPRFEQYADKNGMEYFSVWQMPGGTALETRPSGWMARMRTWLGRASGS